MPPPPLSEANDLGASLARFKAEEESLPAELGLVPDHKGEKRLKKDADIPLLPISKRTDTNVNEERASSKDKKKKEEPQPAKSVASPQRRAETDGRKSSIAAAVPKPAVPMSPLSPKERAKVSQDDVIPHSTSILIFLLNVFHLVL
jgi:hypothetical protein